MIIKFPTVEERRLALLSPRDRKRAEQLNKIFWHACHLHETITMKRDGMDNEAYVNNPVLEITKLALTQTMMITSSEYQELTKGTK